MNTENKAYNIIIVHRYVLIQSENSNDNNQNGKHRVSCTDRIIMFMESRGRNSVSCGLRYHNIIYTIQIYFIIIIITTVIIIIL